VIPNGHVITNLRFADDVDLIKESPDDLQRIPDKINDISRKYGLKDKYTEIKDSGYRKKYEKLITSLTKKCLQYYV